MRIGLHAWLFDALVLVIIRVILSVLVRLGDMVVEGWKTWGVWARCIRPNPPVSHWLQILEDWVALVNEGGGIGILVAHLNNDLTVDLLLALEVIVSLFERFESIGGALKVTCVLLNLSLVVIDVTCVLFNVGGVLIAKGLGVLNSVLEVRSGKSEGFSGDEHVGGLSNLVLIVLSSEESLSVFETFNLLCEVWRQQRS